MLHVIVVDYSPFTICSVLATLVYNWRRLADDLDTLFTREQ